MKCCVPGCKSDSNKQNLNEHRISFHLFPPDQNLRCQWILAIKRKDWQPTKYSKVCSLHFEDHDILITPKGRRIIRDGACPQLPDQNREKTPVPFEIEELLVLQDSPRKIKLKEEIARLRINERKQKLKIKCLQSKLQRLNKKHSDASTSKVVKCDDAASENQFGDDAELNSNDDVSSDEDPQTRTSSSDTKGHDFGIECSNCRGKVIGFRYTCVQCVDVELCCACEARQAHAQHYVLRIPGPRPQDEVDEMLSRVRETVTKVLHELKDAVPETPELDEPEIRIKTEKEETDDPLGVKLKEESDCTSEANARPHATNILEQAMLEITDIKEEYFEVSDTFVGDGNIKVECEAPGASTASRAGDPRVTTNIGNKPDDSCVPPVAKRRRPAPSTAPRTASATAPPPAPLQALHTSTQATTSLSQPAGSAGAGGGGGGGGGEEVFKVYSHVPVPSKTSKGVQKKS